MVDINCCGANRNLQYLTIGHHEVEIPIQILSFVSLSYVYKS